MYYNNNNNYYYYYFRLQPSINLHAHLQPLVCSGSVVVTAYDSESGRPGSNP